MPESPRPTGLDAYPESQNVSVRTFRPDDAIAVSRLIGHTMLTVNVADYPVERLRELAEWFDASRVLQLSEQRQCLVACRGEVVVGTIALEGMEVVTFFVAPSSQRTGIGSRLMESIESVARELCVTELQVHASLAGAGFYQRRGFRPSGRILRGHAGDHVEMAKPITAA